MELKFVQPSNEELPILVTTSVFPKVTSARLEQSANAPSDIDVIKFGRIIVENETQPLNTFFPMKSIFDVNIGERSDEQELNA